MKVETAILFALIVQIFFTGMCWANLIAIWQHIKKSDTPKPVDKKKDGTGDTTK